jgi:hypothetical protein
MINSALGTVTVQAIQASKLPAQIKALFDGFTDKTQVSNLIDASVSLNGAQKQLADRFGITVDQSAQAAKATGLQGEALIAYVKKLASSASATKTIGETLFAAQQNMLNATKSGALPQSVKSFDLIIKSIDKTTSSGIGLFNSMFGIRDQFIAFTQAVDGLKGNVRGSLFSIVSDAEKQQMQQADLAKLFGDLGRDVPSSIEELIALGKSIDFTTKEGLDLAAVFPSLVTAFEQTKGAVDALVSSLNPNRFRTFTDFAIASSYARQGIPLNQLPTENMPSYAVGTSYVPNDGVAMLHQGEAVLTKSQNTDMTMNSGTVVSLLQSLVNKVGAMEYDMKRTADGTQRTARELEDITGGDVTIMTEAA